MNRSQVNNWTKNPAINSLSTVVESYFDLTISVLDCPCSTPKGSPKHHHDNSTTESDGASTIMAIDENLSQVTIHPVHVHKTTTPGAPSATERGSSILSKSVTPWWNKHVCVFSFETQTSDRLRRPGCRLWDADCGSGLAVLPSD